VDKCIEEGHAGKVVESGYRLEEGQMHFTVNLWGCIRCNATSKTPWEDAGEYKRKEIDHSNCDDTPCFGCKAKGLQLATGDAAGNIVASGTTQKKWDKELAFYKEARAQGVQPEGTSRKVIEKALDASEVLNKPYNAGKMPKAKDVTKETVAVMKEIGQI
jgi:hypothetical protein